MPYRGVIAPPLRGRTRTGWLLVLMGLLTLAAGCPAAGEGAPSARDTTANADVAEASGGDTLDVPPVDAGPLGDAGACRGARPLRCGDRLPEATTVEALPNVWGGYACTQRAESGPEAVYAFVSDEACRVALRLTGLTEDLDLLLLDTCDPWSCTAAASTPLDIQDIEAVVFDATAGRGYLVAVDGYADAAGAYALATDCLCGSTAGTFDDGAWEMHVDRRWNSASGDAQLPSDPLDEADYEPVADGAVLAVTVSDGWARVALGDTPLGGTLVPGASGRLTYDLTDGTFAGGRFVVWAGASGLQAELTIYGSGVPVVSSERGALTARP